MIAYGSRGIYISKDKMDRKMDVFILHQLSESERQTLAAVMGSGDISPYFSSYRLDKLSRKYEKFDGYLRFYQ